MSDKTLFLTEELYDYMKKISLREPEILKRLRDETAKDPMHMMQITPEQGQFMSFLVKVIGATRALELGVYTGYSSLSVAMALPDEGSLVACDISKEWTSVARRYWRKAGVDSKIDLYLAPAIQTLDRLLDRGEVVTFDFAFIDADKENYDGYYERVLKLLRPGGLIGVDNVFWLGNVVEPEATDKSTQAIRAFNEKIHHDSRVDITMIPIGDGLTLVRKR